MTHLMTENNNGLWKSIAFVWKHRASWLYVGRFVFSCLVSFKDPCWLRQHHRYFSKVELRIPWQSIGQINKYLLTSGTVLFLWLLGYSVHITESFYWTEFYFYWIKAFLYASETQKPYGWSENLLQHFYHRKSRYFLRIMKTDNTGWHSDVTVDPLLLPQNFLNMPGGKFCQNQWLPFSFFFALSWPLFHCMLFELYGYAIRPQLRKDVMYSWAQL